MIEWEEKTVETVRQKRRARLELTDRVVINVEDYGFASRPILAGLYCHATSMDGPFEEARDAVPAKVLALMEQAMPVLRAIVEEQSREAADALAAAD